MEHEVSGTKARVLFIRQAERKRSGFVRECPNLDRRINVGAIEKADAATYSARATCANSYHIHMQFNRDHETSKSKVNRFGKRALAKLWSLGVRPS